MKVICAGYPKTGTKTLNAALKELGYDCYDFVEHFQFLKDDWLQILQRGGSIEDFRRMFENVDAVTGIPACFFWEELHKAFPDAKIIFHQRETEDIWWRSYENQIKSNASQTIFKFMSQLSPTFRAINHFASTITRITFGSIAKNPFFGDFEPNELMARKFYRLHNSYFLHNAPMEQVLTIDLTQGWQPLCDFLGVAVPDTPFPHKNKSASLGKNMLKSNPLMIRMKHEMMATSFCILCLVGFGTYKLATRFT